MILNGVLVCVYSAVSSKHLVFWTLLTQYIFVKLAHVDQSSLVQQKGY